MHQRGEALYREGNLTPKAVELFDCHAHTNLSTCAERDLTLDVYRSELDRPDSLLGYQALTNHGFQVYFPPHLIVGGAFVDQPQYFSVYEREGNAKFLAFLRAVEKLNDDRLFFGVEVELMADGRLTCSQAVRKKAQVVVGAVHWIPRCFLENPKKSADPSAVLCAFFRYTGALVRAGIDVLAHPFRYLTEKGIGIEPWIVKEVVAICARQRVAVELNLRAGVAGVTAMIREAEQRRLPLALATDAHLKSHVGDLRGHLEAIRNAGFDPEEILLYTPNGR